MRRQVAAVPGQRERLDRRASRRKRPRCPVWRDLGTFPAITSHHHLRPPVLARTKKPTARACGRRRDRRGPGAVVTVPLVEATDDERARRQGRRARRGAARRPSGAAGLRAVRASWSMRSRPAIAARAAVARRVERLGGGRSPCARRRSARTRPTASFAGQHATKLNVVSARPPSSTRWSDVRALGSHRGRPRLSQAPASTGAPRVASSSSASCAPKLAGVLFTRVPDRRVATSA